METRNTRLVQVFHFIMLAVLLARASSAIAQKSAATSPSSAPSAETRTARALDIARTDPLNLYAFLVRMPKGADLHNHLTGAVYAESWIRYAAEDNLCVDLATHSFFQSRAMTDSLPPQPVCGDGNIPAAHAMTDQHLYDALIDAFSMRSFVPTTGVSGHDHFFDAFAKFHGVAHIHVGEFLDEVAARAAAQNEQYLELMETPPFEHTAAIAKELGWHANRSFGDFRDQLFAKGLRDDVAAVRAYFDEAESIRRQAERCDLPNPAVACAVQLRYLYQVLRGFPPKQVFAQTLLGFEAASADPRIVGINLVMPEDGYVSMSDYALQMRMVGYLHGVYPKVHITLHAGELAPGLVTYDGLSFHVRQAVEIAHAERIGHGVDIMFEDRPYELLKEMAAKHVMVEINLSSNDL